MYFTHRLAFLYMTGSIPKEVDHINHVKPDNRWKNLRAANRIINGRNRSMHCDNTSGVTGVYWHKKKGKWQAGIRVNDKRIYLGVFKHLEDATAARKTAEARYGFHPNHGVKQTAHA